MTHPLTSHDLDQPIGKYVGIILTFFFVFFGELSFFVVKYDIFGSSQNQNIKFTLILSQLTLIDAQYKNAQMKPYVHADNLGWF